MSLKLELEHQVNAAVSILLPSVSHHGAGLEIIGAIYIDLMLERIEFAMVIR